MVALNVMDDPMFTDVDPEMETDVTRTSGSVMVILCVSYSPLPSSAVALTVTVPALSRSITQRPPGVVSVCDIIEAQLLPEVIDQVT